MNNSNREEYYARIEKITGNHLLEKTIGVYNAPFVSKAIELLASCGVLGYNFWTLSDMREFYAQVWAMKLEGKFEHMFAEILSDHNQYEDRWRFYFEGIEAGEQLMIAGGTFGDCQRAYADACEKNIPVILGALFANGTSAISVVWPGQSFPFTACKEHLVEASEQRYFDWIDLSNQMVNIAKAILLEGTEWERSDIMSLLRSGKTTLLMAHPEWPWVSRYVDIMNEQDGQWFLDIVTSKFNANEQATIQGKTVLIVGLGSLGSVAGDHFRMLGCNVIGIDGKDVSIHNPVRQLYGTEHIGDDKAFALASILGKNYAAGLAYLPGICGISATKDGNRMIYERSGARKFVGIKSDVCDSRDGSEFFRTILDEFQPDLVVLATAHPAEYRMADLCRQKNIPHVIGRCYNRARWFEITSVDGESGPCFGCLQGHLYKGAQPSLTEEQLARYDMAGDEANKVQAEPATRVDTARCADSMARFSFQLLQDKAHQAPWFARMLQEERTCMIGGNYAERNIASGEWSFGVTSPGGVALYGVINFVGSETEETKTCIYCGKTHEVLIKRRSPDV